MKKQLAYLYPISDMQTKVICKCIDSLVYLPSKNIDCITVLELYLSIKTMIL